MSEHNDNENDHDSDHSQYPAIPMPTENQLIKHDIPIFVVLGIYIQFVFQIGIIPEDILNFLDNLFRVIPIDYLLTIRITDWLPHILSLGFLLYGSFRVCVDSYPSKQDDSTAESNAHQSRGDGPEPEPEPKRPTSKMILEDIFKVLANSALIFALLALPVVNMARINSGQDATFFKCIISIISYGAFITLFFFSFIYGLEIVKKFQTSVRQLFNYKREGLLAQFAFWSSFLCLYPTMFVGFLVKDAGLNLL
ncbi:TPA: hypothetical protein ACVU4L_004192 [Vibrio parahaemolyticus]